MYALITNRKTVCKYSSVAIIATKDTYDVPKLLNFWQLAYINCEKFKKIIYFQTYFIIRYILPEPESHYFSVILQTWK